LGLEIGRAAEPPPARAGRGVVGAVARWRHRLRGLRGLDVGEHRVLREHRAGDVLGEPARPVRTRADPGRQPRARRWPLRRLGQLAAGRGLGRRRGGRRRALAGEQRKQPPGSLRAGSVLAVGLQRRRRPDVPRELPREELDDRLVHRDQRRGHRCRAVRLAAQRGRERRHRLQLAPQRQLGELGELRAQPIDVDRRRRSTVGQRVADGPVQRIARRWLGGPRGVSRCRGCCGGRAAPELRRERMDLAVRPRPGDEVATGVLDQPRGRGIERLVEPDRSIRRHQDVVEPEHVDGRHCHAPRLHVAGERLRARRERRDADRELEREHRVRLHRREHRRQRAALREAHHPVERPLGPHHALEVCDRGVEPDVLDVVLGRQPPDALLGIVGHLAERRDGRLAGVAGGDVGHR